MPSCYRHPGRESYIRCQRCDRTICPDCMRDAAVGFQCPECVAAGAKDTRAGRTAYGGLRPTDAGRTSLMLIAANLVVWALIVGTGGFASRWYGYLALLPRGRCTPGGQATRYFPDVFNAQTCAAVPNATWVRGVSDGAYWQLLTSAFSHVEVWHIGFNMLALWVLGPQLELVIGRARYLTLYLLSALSGSVVVYWFAPETGSTLGASGAIFGLLGALLVVTLKVGGQAQQILIWVAINFAITVTVPNVSWQGHLGGFLGGAAVAAILVYAPRQHRAQWQSLGVGALAVLLVVATLLRTAALA